MKIYQQLKYKKFCLDYNIFKPWFLSIHASCKVNNEDIPDIFTHLRIESICSDYSSDNLPKSIIYLDLGELFDNPVNNLPTKLKILKLGDDFNHPVDLLPEGLIELHLGFSFNQKLDDLPQSLEILKIDKITCAPYSVNFTLHFDYPVKCLPCSIKKIIISNNIKEHFKDYADKIEILK